MKIHGCGIAYIRSIEGIAELPNEVVGTLKGDGSAAWAVVHADTVEEAERLIDDALKGSFFQTLAEASTLLAGATKVANGMPPQSAAGATAANGFAGPQDRQQVQQNPAQNQWNNPPAQGSATFAGSAHPQGKTCPMCGAGIVGKQPREKRMWTCPNQRSKGDGHYVEWIN